MKKLVAAVLSLALAAALFTGCAATDVVLKYSHSSFENIVKSFPGIVKEDQNNNYIITADKETLLKVSKDYSVSDEDIVLSTPLQPFVKAGLDVTKLGKGYKADDASLYLITDFGKGTGKSVSPAQALFESVTYDRKALTYHQELDHYGIVLNGGKFEFAKNYKTNDKDIVYVIAAKPLRDIGVNVEKIDGWVFKTMKDDSGKDVDVLLKPFNLA